MNLELPARSAFLWIVCYVLSIDQTRLDTQKTEITGHTNRASSQKNIETNIIVAAAGQGFL